MTGSPKTILVVDDEPDVVTFLSTLFEDNGFRVITAENGAEAIQKFRSEHPDLVTLDITMPEQSGVKTYRQMKEDPDLGKTPIIIVTGVSSDFEKFISQRKQVPKPDGYISKPIEKEELLKIVSGLIPA
jgi:CheY-like chemotaxis protein